MATSDDSPSTPDAADSAGAPTVDAAAASDDAPAGSGEAPGGPGLRWEGAAVGDALGRFMKVALSRGREGLGRATVEGRQRLEQRQLRRDLEVMYRKLGREVIRLVESGDIQHPGVVRGVQRIHDVEARIETLRAAGGGAADMDGDPDERPEGEPADEDSAE